MKKINLVTVLALVAFVSFIIFSIAFYMGNHLKYLFYFSMAFFLAAYALDVFSKKKYRAHFNEKFKLGISMAGIVYFLFRALTTFFNI